MESSNTILDADADADTDANSSIDDTIQEICTDLKTITNELDKSISIYSRLSDKLRDKMLGLHITINGAVKQFNELLDIWSKEYDLNVNQDDIKQSWGEFLIGKIETCSEIIGTDKLL
jgi:hypothetical protein